MSDQPSYRKLTIMLAALRTGTASDLTALKWPLVYPPFKSFDYGVRDLRPLPISLWFNPVYLYRFLKVRRRYQTDLKRVAALNQHYEKQHTIARAAFLDYVQKQNGEIESFQQDYRNGKGNAIETYQSAVLSLLASANPHEAFLLEYVAAVKTLRLDYRFQPGITQEQLIEQSLQIATRIFESDICGHIKVVAINGFVKTRNPDSGARRATWIFSARLTREDLAALKQCPAELDTLIELGAHISEDPADGMAITFDEKSALALKQTTFWQDMSATTDSRPHLGDLTDSEYFAIVKALLAELGYDLAGAKQHIDGSRTAISADTSLIIQRVVNTKHDEHWRKNGAPLRTPDVCSNSIVITDGAFVLNSRLDLAEQYIDGRDLGFLLKSFGVVVKQARPTETTRRFRMKIPNRCGTKSAEVWVEWLEPSINLIVNVVL